MTGPPARGVRVRACAKINLTLRVLGLRPDGYHELRTTFQSLALHDTLTFEAARGPFTITTDDPRCPCDDSNLVWKAAERLWVVSGRRGPVSGVRVHIRKRIPSEAGLGGGSSDAAATLRALRDLWQVRIDDRVLVGLGAILGADVPFFFDGGTMLGVERGDLLFPLVDQPSARVVLARPDIGVSTREAFGWWDEAQAQLKPAPAAAARSLEWTNDLQGPVVRRHGRILKLVKALQRNGARYAAMSGSGSSVFGLFDDQADARRAAQALEGPGTSAWVTRTTTHRQHRRLSAVDPLDR